MINFTEKDVRAVRGGATGYNKYWVYIELLIDGNWIKAYFINEEIKKWHQSKTELYPSVENMQKYLKEELERINNFLENGWKLVSYDEYKEIVHKYHFPLEYIPEIVNFNITLYTR